MNNGKRCKRCNRKLPIAAFDDAEKHSYCKSCNDKLRGRYTRNRVHKEQERLEKKLNLCMIEKYVL